MLLNWSHQCHETRPVVVSGAGCPLSPARVLTPRPAIDGLGHAPALTGASPRSRWMRRGCRRRYVVCSSAAPTTRRPRAFDDLWILRLSPDGTGRCVRKSTTTRGGARFPPDRRLRHRRRA